MTALDPLAQDARRAQRSERAVSPRFLADGWRFLAAGLLVGLAAGSLIGMRRGVVRRAQSTVMALRPVSADESGAAARNVAEVQATALRSWPCLEQAALAVPAATQAVLAEDHVADVRSPLALRRRLAVTAGAESGLVMVALESAQVEAACALVNAIVDAHISRQRESQRQARETTAREVAAELLRQQSELASAERRHAAFLREHPGTAMPGSAPFPGERRLAELQQSVARAELDAAVAEAEAASVRAHIANSAPGERLPMPFMDEASQRQVAALRERADAVELSLRALRLEVTAEHPAAVQTSQRASSLRAEADAAADRLSRAVLLAMEQKAGHHRRLAESLARQLDAERVQLAAADPEIAAGQALEASALRLRRLVEDLHARQQALALEGRIDAQGAGPQAALVLERATPAASPVVAGLHGAAAAGGLAGMLVGALVAFVRAALRPRAASASDLDGLAPLLARSPLWTGGSDVADALLTPELAQAGLMLHTALSTLASPVRVVMVVPLSRDPWLQGAGAVLAATAAAGGRRTLLLDVDRRHRDRHSPFPASATVQASAIAHGRRHNGGARAEVAVQGAAAHADGPDGHAVVAAASRAIDAARGGHDLVVVDAPPLQDGAAAQALASRCDGVVLLLQHGCLLSQVEDAVRDLGRCGAVVLGSVLHGPTRRRLRRHERPMTEAPAAPAPRASAVHDALRSGGPA